ncbi:ASN_HP2_G0013530.mRNA.1.CDS.1 [Saccharomyces cerevisiae]|nr:ASN_HP2_G0013530.mRNA.1.CDS.1 [Saccharomyces cerevisiae]CAI6539052.1 ASN_HP2_G0013530.mRNA.1.CDS.1 [Saccharomyces cerevisiae]
MILRRLMTALLSDDYGVVIFAISNRHRDELCSDGVQPQSLLFPSSNEQKSHQRNVNIRRETQLRNGYNVFAQGFHTDDSTDSHGALDI